MWSDNLNWHVTALFLFALTLLGFAMKLVALFQPVKKQIQPHAVSWVLVSPDSVLRSQPAISVLPVVLRILVLFVALLLSYWIYWQLVRGFHLRGILMSYLAVPVLFLMSEFLVAVETLCFYPGGLLIPSLHRRPWLARSVGDFWGNRWNLWFSDWFRYAIFGRLRRHPIFALLLAFAVSGLMHEWVINVPLYCLTGRMLFGSMIAYFLLQAAGILSERYFLKGHPHLMRMFTWLVVFAPLPLVLNEGLLRVLHLWPEPLS